MGWAGRVAWLWRSREGRRAVGFWLAGLLNNSNFVIMNAGGKHLAAGGVGLVYFCNIAPCVLVKGSSAFWFHLVGYEQRVMLCAALMMTCVSLVGLSDDTGVKLLGVSIGAFASALGEATFLAMSSRAGPGQQVCLTAWSSGTGMAGVFGYFFVFFFTQLLGWTFAACALAANSLALCWMLNFGSLVSERASLGSCGGGEQAQFEPVLGEGSLDGDRGGAAHANGDGFNHVLQDGSLQDAGSSTETETEHMILDRTSGQAVGGGVQSCRVVDLAACEQDAAAQREQVINLSSAGDGSLSVWDRAMIVVRLRDFTLPLFAVYVAEYTLQSGCWAAVGFPVEDKASRDQFYLYSNWVYQAGVFFSRSSGMIVTLSKRQLWIMPAMQCSLLAFFLLNGVKHLWWNWGLLSLAFVVGLLGGAVYVHGFILIAKATLPSQRETALGTASLADTFGIMLSNLLGIMVQGCMYGINSITDDGRPPTFKCGYDY